ncbi:MAG: arginine deiminase family protein [Chloroflexota bacterium]
MIKRYGVRSAYGDLKRVIMHRPGPELTLVRPDTLDEFHFDAPVDVDKFVGDYDLMRRTLENHGVETLLLTDILANDDDSLNYIRYRPNMTYTRDLATVFASGAVLMGMHLRGRWGDAHILGRAFKRLGVPILGAIEQPGFLEGGGVTMIGEETAVAALCSRANEVGTRRLRELILGKDVKYFLEVAVPLDQIHIDGSFMMLNDDLCLIHEASFQTFPCRLYEAGKFDHRHILLPEFLAAQGIQMIPITEQERLDGHLNVVVTRKGKTAVGFAEATRLGAEMAKHGWQVDSFPSETLFLGNGGAHCMTCPLLVT